MGDGTIGTCRTRLRLDRKANSEFRLGRRRRLLARSYRDFGPHRRGYRAIGE